MHPLAVDGTLTFHGIHVVSIFGHCDVEPPYHGVAEQNVLYCRAAAFVSL
jgi:hypothetical protein